jgi:hypothetical protein
VEGLDVKPGLYVDLSFPISPKALRCLVPGAEAAAELPNDSHTKGELANWRNYLWSALQRYDEEPADELAFLD